MALVAAICPQCGGEIQLDKSAETGFCLHCGTKVYIEEALAARANASAGDLAKKENCLALAKEACEAHEYNRALEYAEKVFELDFENEEAWEIKAIASCWLSSLENPLFNQAINAAKHSVEYSDDKRAAADSLLGQMTDSLLPLNQIVRKLEMQKTGNQRVASMAELKGRLALVYGAWFEMVEAMRDASAPVLLNELEKMKKAEQPGNFFNCFYNSLIATNAESLYGTTFSEHLSEILDGIPCIKTYRRICADVDSEFEKELAPLQATHNNLSNEISSGFFFGKKGKQKLADLRSQLAPIDEQIAQLLEKKAQCIADRCS